MSRRRNRRKKLPEQPVELSITGLSHEGEGIAQLDGKVHFVSGGLPGESVVAHYTEVKNSYAKCVVSEVLSSSPERVVPPCEYAEICGGCSLQHWGTEYQIQHKQQVLAEQFEHFGGIAPERWLSPLTAMSEGYRRKARLGVRYVDNKGGALVGFREKRSNFICVIDKCKVLHPVFGERIEALKQLVNDLSCSNKIAQFEVAMGDDIAAIIVRHLVPLTESDIQRIKEFAQETGIHMYSQAKGPDTIFRLWPEAANKADERLEYSLPEQGVRYQFHPTDFTQVNTNINRQMMEQAMSLLDPQSNERILDLFCGLGNFTLPIAKKAKTVVGVEGSDAMVKRGYENAKLNGIDNVTFYAADLTGDYSDQDWVHQGFDKILIDPPRSGAIDVIEHFPKLGASRVVYVSCNPATLARDSGSLIAQGYRLVAAGVMDMFPHTAHVESMALFEK
ncbi:MAG: 23S rRNA (uracil(1939)-C(5))-methyltransferase RlmD [Kangiellaceae bacterium]|nr:23S rRNA (uracil(1939)-C(5))-methyltransferase RlmD [Kangiellaceae bacterium]|tara:strand:+ start:3704 stop:5047 length:1344 start_codon:yes stop_codon:yes gene_type:complete